MIDAPLAVSPALLADLPALHALIERAYRGEDAKVGWSHEADLVDGPRTDRATLEAIVAAPDEALLVAGPADAPIGCVHVARRGGGLAYLGLLSVDPGRQAGGLGRALLAAAETYAAAAFGATAMEMTAISCRTELIAYYERRGYRLTGELRPFPVRTDPPLALAVLTRSLP